MTKGLLQQPPPFEPTVIEAEAITNLGFMFAEILILLIFMVLMIYLYRKAEFDLPIIIVYLFSLVIGMEAISHLHTHFSPFLEIFFLLFQTSLFLMKGLEYHKARKKRH